MAFRRLGMRPLDRPSHDQCLSMGQGFLCADQVTQEEGNMKRPRNLLSASSLPAESTVPFGNARTP
jgi:hypothetical protein